MIGKPNTSCKTIGSQNVTKKKIKNNNNKMNEKINIVNNKLNNLSLK